MISGVELGSKSPSAIEIIASSSVKGNIEIWLDDLKEGKLIATVPITESGSNWKSFSKSVKGISGHHDVFVKFPSGSEGKMLIKAIKFVR